MSEMGRKRRRAYVVKSERLVLVAKDPAVAPIYSTMAYLTLFEIGIKITKAENRKITNDLSSTRDLRKPRSHAASRQDYAGLREVSQKTSSRKEMALKQVSEDVMNCVWWEVGKEDMLPWDTEFFLKVRREVKCE